MSGSVTQALSALPSLQIATPVLATTFPLCGSTVTMANGQRNTHDGRLVVVAIAAIADPVYAAEVTGRQLFANAWPLTRNGTLRLTMAVGFVRIA